MDKSKRKRRVTEWCKDVLIVALLCSAVWLVARSQLLGSLDDFLQDEKPTVGTVQTQGGARADAARPLRIIANLPGGSPLRCAVQDQSAAADALFQQVAGVLAETLSSAEEPEQVTRAQWEAALTTAPGVVFDFQGALPMPVLVGWLAGEDTALTAVVRRLTLTIWQGTVALYYRDEDSGRYYRCLSVVTNEHHLAQALSTLTENGAMYAFESDQYEKLDPDTLLLGAISPPAVYSASNPMTGGYSALEGLMGELGISIDASSFYPSGVEQVARNGSDSIRLSERGIAIYEAGEEHTDRFRIAARQETPSIFESVEACRQLAAATVGSHCGQARLYLISAQEREAGLEVRFGYCLNGSPVQLEEDCAARFLVQKGQITQFQLNFRSYANRGETSVILPIPQAAAAMESMGLEGQELLLIYSDAGADTATATWVAVGDRSAEER